MPKSLNPQDLKQGAPSYLVLKPLHRRPRWHLFISVALLLLCGWVLRNAPTDFNFQRRHDDTQNAEAEFSWNDV